MTNPRPALFVEVPEPGAPALLVTLTSAVKARTGHEYLAGMTAGFTPVSACSLVVNGKGKAFLFDEEAAKGWAEALKTFAPPEWLAQPRHADDVATGPWHADMMKRQAQAQAELEQLAAEGKLNALALEAAAKAEAEAAAKLAAEKAAAEAQALADAEAKAAGVTEVVTTAPVSTGEADTDKANELATDAAAETKAAAEKAAHDAKSKRGSKNPRG